MGNLTVFIINVARVPNTSADILIVHLVEYSITGQDNKVMIFSYLEALYIRNTSDNIWISSTKFNLSFWVTKCP
jgi:hypothetical protein